MRFSVGLGLALALGLARSASACPLPDPRSDAPWPSRTATTSCGPFSGLRDIRFGDRGALSLGGEVRLRYEGYRGSLDSDALLGQWLAHADAQWEGRLRVFGQLKGAYQYGRTGGARAIDVDELAIQQLFLELQPQAGLRIRLGRTEVRLEDGSLVSPRTPTNTRVAFDGLRVFADLGASSLQVFALAPVVVTPGVLDNPPSAEDLFSGAWFSGPLFGPALGFDLFGLFQQRLAARFGPGQATERRATAGARFFGRAGPARYNLQVLGQAGQFGEGGILAWAAYAAAHWAVLGRALEVSARAGYASGDADPLDGRLETANLAYPAFAILGNDFFVGTAANLVMLRPSVRGRLLGVVDYALDATVLWRAEAQDGLYFPTMALGFLPAPERGRYVGTQLSATALLYLTPVATLGGRWAHVIEGSALEDAPVAGGDAVFVWLSARI